MNLAIILVGNVRTFDECRDNFCKTFERFNPDIYINTSDVKFDHHPAIQGRIGDHSDEPLEVNKFLDDIWSNGIIRKGDVVYKVVQDTKEFMETEFKFRTPLDKLGNRTYSQFYRLNDCMEILNNYLYKYDVVLKTRFDLLYNSDKFTDQLFDPVFLSQAVVFDAGNVYPNDCIFFSTQQNMTNISNFLNNEFFEPKFRNSDVDPPHRLLRNAFDYHNLRHMPVRLIDCVVRKNGVKHYY